MGYYDFYSLNSECAATLCYAVYIVGALYLEWKKTYAHLCVCFELSFAIKDFKSILDCLD